MNNLIPTLNFCSFDEVFEKMVEVNYFHIVHIAQCGKLCLPPNKENVKTAYTQWSKRQEINFFEI